MFTIVYINHKQPDHLLSTRYEIDKTLRRIKIGFRGTSYIIHLTNQDLNRSRQSTKTQELFEIHKEIIPEIIVKKLPSFLVCLQELCFRLLEGSTEIIDENMWFDVNTFEFCGRVLSEPCLIKECFNFRGVRI